MTLKIRPAKSNDAEEIVEIYNHYILKTVITFEEQTITKAEMLSRMQEVERASLPWLVAEVEGRIVGYAYAGKWKGRCAYRYSVESSIYLADKVRGHGVGTKLYEVLLAELRTRKIHIVIGGIALPNEQSIGLHEKLGFQKVAHFREVGYKFEKWIDVGYWQLTL